MKPVSDVTCLCVDNGLFADMAVCLARTYKKVYYCTPGGIQSAFPKMNNTQIGVGLEGIEVVRDVFGDHFDAIDLFVFPDCYYGTLQLQLDKMGKKVWGARMGEELELSREGCKRLMKQLGLPVGGYEVVKGMSGLRDHLKTHKNQHVKVNSYRGCFDDSTEILTENGWKLFDDLSKSEKVATLDLNSHEIGFVTPIKYIKYWHDDLMVSIKGKAIDALVTPNHCFWKKTHYLSKPWKYARVDSFYDKAFIIPSGGKWHGDVLTTHFTVSSQSSPTRKYKARNHDIKDWLEFIGWFLSEGCINMAGENHNKYRVTISQSEKSNPDKHRMIRELLVRLGYNVQKEGEIGFSIYDKPLWMELASTCYTKNACSCCGKQFGSHNKKVPDYIRTLPSHLIEYVLNTYRMGDGCQDRGLIRYYTSSKTLADGVQEMIVLTGKGSRIAISAKKGETTIAFGRKLIARQDQLVVTEKRVSRFTRISKNSMQMVEYKGFAYDVTVEPNHTILVRRNGVPFWSGNTFETFKADDYKSVEPKLDEVEYNLGAFKHVLPFIVEDDLPDRAELGTDGYTIDGKYPSKVLSGIEIKDLAYCGIFGDYSKLPEPLTRFNKAMVPVFKEYGYRGFFSTEVRIGKDHVPYMIDFCSRAGSPPNELYQEFYTNLADIIWHGANGILIDPTPIAKYGAEVLIHSSWADKNWQPVDFPMEYRRNIKLRNGTKIGNQFYVIPQAVGLPEIGAICGWGNTMDAAFDMCRDVAKHVTGYYIKVPHEAFDEAEEQIALTEKYNLKMF